MSRGIDEARQKGVRIISRQSFVDLPKVKEIILDKTGILTESRLKVIDQVAVRPKILMHLAASLEAGVDHPIAQAISTAYDTAEELKRS